MSKRLEAEPGLLGEIAFQLTRPSAPCEVAFLQDGPRILYVRTPMGSPACFSAPVLLLQAIHDAFPSRARAITRARIFTTVRASSAARGMVQVAGKRMTDKIQPWVGLGIEIPPLVEMQPTTPGPFWPELPAQLQNRFHPENTSLSALCEELSECVHRDEKLYQSDRPVAALLVSREQKLLGWAPNSNSKNRTLHAEVNLIQGYQARTGQGLPPGSTVYTSLKPCKMCAGMIWDAAQDVSSLRVVYGQHDPGTKAQNTVLDVGSEARRRATADLKLLQVVLQFGPRGPS